MRVFVLAVVLAACSDDPELPVDAHALGACDEHWLSNGYTECEAACFDSLTALGASGEACQATTATGIVNCSKTFEFAGLTGCCTSNKPKLLFRECD